MERLLVVSLLVFLCNTWGVAPYYNDRDTQKTIFSERSKRAFNAPIVINTWPFKVATHTAWDVVANGGTATDAIVGGCSACEELQCDGTVGFGGSPDDTGQTSLDALVMDGDSMEVGAVANLRMTRDAIKAARLVLERTHHSILAGNEASYFATEMGLSEWKTLTTNESLKEFQNWKLKNCQPNFYTKGTVSPDPLLQCGPYHGNKQSSRHAAPLAEHVKAGKELIEFQTISHDTISMIAIDRYGSSACGSSTNGLSHKIAGRVGDAAVPGGGCYADSRVGACAATGDGDVHVRFLPCYQAVENMRQGMSAQQASDDAMRRIVDKVGHDVGFQGALVIYDIRRGDIGSTRIGDSFNFSYTYQDETGLRIVHVAPLETLG